MRDPVAGAYFVIGSLGSGGWVPGPWFAAFLCFAKSTEIWFCEIVDDPWWFLDEFWRILISFPLFRKIAKGFVGFLAGPPVPVVQLAFVFPVFRGGLRRLPPNLPISL